MDHFWYLCFAFVKFSCLLVVDLWPPVGKRADLLAFLCVMFYCVFVTLPCGVLGQIWCLIFNGFLIYLINMAIVKELLAIRMKII